MAEVGVALFMWAGFAVDNLLISHFYTATSQVGSFSSDVTGFGLGTCRS